jgi:prepilin-type N-terminal cleavage/methylation domain-containing protein
MIMFHKKTSDNKGFTLIEVIAVLIILGILAAIAVSRVSSNQGDLIAQADIVKTHLRFAQLKALADDTSASWGIDFTAGTSYTLEKNEGAPGINLPGEDGTSHSFPIGSGITVSSNPSPVKFDSWGSPGVASTVTLSLNGVPATIINIANNTGYIP